MTERGMHDELMKLGGEYLHLIVPVFLYLRLSRPPTHTVCCLVLFFFFFLIQVKGGRVTERGTHDEMMKFDGYYLHFVLLPFLFPFECEANTQCVYLHLCSFRLR